MNRGTAYEGQGAEEGYYRPNWGSEAAKLLQYQRPGKEVPFLAVNHRAVGTAAQGSGTIKAMFSGVRLAAVGQDAPPAGDGEK